jgi:hypothetical protein
MQPLHAVVKKGRLVLDEPTDLPEGQVVALLPLDELLAAAESYGASDDGGVTFQILPAAPREFKKPKPVDAAALLAEVKAM